MARKSMSEKLKETIKKEFNYKCAICKNDNPQIHHIDEDHTNNEMDNLLPLCPNCHLTDQHNSSRKIDIPKLQLFRKYKDKKILTKEFEPIYKRMKFLNEVDTLSAREISDSSIELIEFIKTFEKGFYYAEKIEKLNIHGSSLLFAIISDDLREKEKIEKKFRKKIIDNRDKINDLIIELLSYENWKI